MSAADLITVGLSEAANEKLDELRELGIFAEKIDGYRFAISLAIAQGVIPDEISKRSTFLNVGSLDPDHIFRCTVEALMADQLLETTPYRMIERLAEWGVRELHAQAKAGEIDFAVLLEQIKKQSGSVG